MNANDEHQSEPNRPDGFSELVLVVDDVQATTAFYRDQVGLELEHEPSEDWAWFKLGPKSQCQRLAISRGPLLFQEFAPAGKDHRWGPVHFAVRVQRVHLTSMVKRMSKAGFQMHGPTRLEWMQADSYYVYDPAGNLLELWSPDPNSDAEKA